MIRVQWKIIFSCGFIGKIFFCSHRAASVHTPQQPYRPRYRRDIILFVQVCYSCEQSHAVVSRLIGTRKTHNTET